MNASNVVEKKINHESKIAKYQQGAKNKQYPLISNNKKPI